MVSHDYLHYIVLYASFLVVYYVNFFLLIDKLLFLQKIWKYIFINVLLLVVVCSLLQYAHDVFRPVVELTSDTKGGFHPPRTGKILNDLLCMIAFIGLSVMAKMVTRWRDFEKLNSEIEKKQAEAELKNLKQQLSPHFVFNTLNNIYALIAHDANKAQQAVLELSGLLRHMLYENKGRFVLVEQEMAFIQDYIGLMRLRQTSLARIDVQLSTEICNNCYIAPLLFIPIIENAFKHGIDSMRNSYVDISIVAVNSHTISCCVINSCHKKVTVDNSGLAAGIGLENLRRQLQLLYPDKHSLKFEVDDERYMVELIINLYNEIPQ